MNESGRLLVVVNNAAARARLAWPRVREALARNGVRFDAHETRHAGDAGERTRAALGEGYATVAALGGDGTLGEVASGFFETFEGLADGETPRSVNPSAALALLPAGTGDDFARGLSGGRREPLESWLRRLVAHCRGGVHDPRSGVWLVPPGEAEGGAGVKSGEVASVKPEDVEAARHAGTTRAVDVICGSVDAGARRFIALNAASLGVSAEACARVAAQGGAVRRLPGEARFAVAALAALKSWRERRVRLRVGGHDSWDEWFECQTNVVVVSNGPFAGGGMNFAPGARTDDGLLDVLAASGFTRPRIVRELLRVRQGTHTANPRIRFLRAARVGVEVLDEGESLPVEADGDGRGRTPAEFRVLPAALRVVW